MQSIPIDAESLEKMRTAKEPMLCVDKTAYLHRLVADELADRVVERFA